MDIGEYIEAHRGELESWGKQVRDEICALHGELLKVPPSMRVKDIESARRKQLKKGYLNPADDMTDLVGVRFVVLTSDDLLPIRTCLQDSSTWICKQTRNPQEEIAESPETFGYQSYHYELRPRGVPKSAVCCEVQVRTLLQHTIAELSHDSMYKATQRVPSHAERLVARSMALMETTDELLCRAMAAVREAQAPALEVRRIAKEATSAIGGSNRMDLQEDVLSSYSDMIDSSSPARFREFLRENDFVLNKIQTRVGRGIFADPAATLICYWLVGSLQRKASRLWPFPGSNNDLQLIFSDLGIAIH